MKTLRFIFVVAFISIALSMQAQKRVAVFIVSYYDNTGIPENDQWNEGDMGGGTVWSEFWNDTYLLWELLFHNPLGVGYDYQNEYIYVYFADGDNFQPVGYDSRYVVPIGTALTDNEASYNNVVNLFSGLANGTELIPKLTENDFLFIWTMGHGGNNENGSYFYLTDDIITETEFANLLNNITAQKKVIWMQQGYAGGFADYFTNQNNVIFYSACDEITNAFRANDLPYLENEILGLEEETYYHGEFDFHTYSPMAGKSPDGVLQYNGVPYSTADADGNSIVSIDEIHDWETNWTGIGSVMHDPGNIAATTSLKYPNILSENVSNDLVLSGYIGITTRVGVSAGVTLTFDYNSEVYLDYDGELIIDEGATLVIHRNSKINSYCNNGNRKITINGDLVVEPDVTFMSINPIGDTKMILTINNPELDLSLFDCSFNQVIITKYNFNNSFDHCDIRESQLTGTNGNYGFSNQCIIQGSIIHLTSNTIGYTINEVNLVDCDISGPANLNGFIIVGYPLVTIESANIINCHNGITFFNCGKEHGLIQGCTITNCSHAGLYFFNSMFDIIDNQVFNNGYGILSYNRSSLHIEGNESFVTQEIRDNEFEEITASVASFPHYFHYNLVQDDNNEGYPLVKYTGPDAHLDVTNNCWGSTFQPKYDLEPTICYDWDPIWNCLQGAAYGSGSNDEAMYLAARENIETENYAAAKEGFGQIVDEYPESKYAEAALKELLPLEAYTENSYVNLKAYYDTDSTIQENAELAKLADFLSNFCDIKLENYPIAIAWFEDVIQNPESMEDSIFAIIDLGYTYFLMENGQKSSYVGNMPQYKPVSVEQFDENRDYLLSLLPGDKLSETMKESITALKTGELLQNVPNPFNGTTQIWYKLDTQADVMIRVYDYTGKEVKSLYPGTMDKGSHPVEFKSEDLPSGIYFYTLEINGRVSDSKKMTVLR